MTKKKTLPITQLEEFHMQPVVPVVVKPPCPNSDCVGHMHFTGDQVDTGEKIGGQPVNALLHRCSLCDEEAAYREAYPRTGNAVRDEDGELNYIG